MSVGLQTPSCRRNSSYNLRFSRVKKIIFYRVPFQLIFTRIKTLVTFFSTVFLRLLKFDSKTI